MRGSTERYLPGFLRLLAVLIFLPAIVKSQQAPIPFNLVPHPYSSKLHDGVQQLVIAEGTDVKIGGASWLQLRFGDYHLGEHSFIAVTSTSDGGRQILSAQSLPEWHNASAYFNGDTVRVDLHVAPGDKGVFYKIASVVAGKAAASQASTTLAPQDLCGQDDRVHSDDPRVGRIVPVGCTGWLTSTGAILTAGHCYNPTNNKMDILQFDVPASRCDGTIVNPGPDDQYPINRASISAAPGSPKPAQGNDWAVFSADPNANGVRPVIGQKAFYRMTSTIINFGAVTDVQVTGYGVDDTPKGCGGGENAQNQTEQTAFGPFVGEKVSAPDNVLLTYKVDTMGGNSGSPVIYPASDVTIGIHTHGGCQSGGSNSGTGFKNESLKRAIQLFSGPNVIFVDANHVSGIKEDGTVFQPYRSLETAVKSAAFGDTLVLVTGFYAGGGMSFPMGKALALRAPVGSVTIGPTPPPQ
jgi:V8-like Glu-specific endopeptidase